MLKTYSSHREFLLSLDANLNCLSHDSQLRLKEFKFRSALMKVRLLNTDLAYPILAPLYSATGRPGNDPTIYLRSFILMGHFGYTSIDHWCSHVTYDPLLMILIGVDSFSFPSDSSHYDFISRLSGEKLHLNNLFPKGLFSKDKLAELKKSNKLKRNEKLVNFDGRVSNALMDDYSSPNHEYKSRDFYALQKLLNAIAVIPSQNRNIIPSKNLILSGDGTCLHIHCSPFGNRAIPKSDNETSDDKVYRYGNLKADYGWDSDLMVFYFGHTLHNTSYHDPVLGVDLPVFLTLEPASQHDLLTSISSVCELIEMNPSLKPEHICYDSASDCPNFYRFLRNMSITPIIDHNTHGKEEDCILPNRVLQFNNHGVPICMNGTAMMRDGRDNKRTRTKYRCPYAVGNIKSCNCKHQCCPDNDYGKVVYIQDNWDYRWFGPVVYRSEQWEEIYNNRTCTERINNRILNDYSLQNDRSRSAGKLMFKAILSAVNIHLDAWIKADTAC